jgi:hypothetical protein
MYKKIIIVIVILTSVSLFNLIFVPPIVIKMLLFGVPAGMLFLLLFHNLYEKSFRFKPRFKVEIGLIFCAVILSMFGAYYFHKQDFAITAVTQRFMYFLLFYPLLHALKPTLEEMVKIIVVLGILYAILYIMQTLAYPTKLVDIKMFIDRKTLRITMAGSGFLFLTYLIAITSFIKTYNKRYLIICLLAMVVFILLGTRQVIAPAALLTILSILFSKKVKSRALTIFLMVLMILPAFFLFKDIFTAMFEFSQKQAGHFSQDIRYKAAIFYLTEFFPSKLAYLTGNGVPSGLSPFGQRVKFFNEIFGFYQSDIGIIGDFSKFGILIVIAQFSIYFRVIFMRLPNELDFIKLSFIALLLTLIVGSSFCSADNVVIICISLYLVDISPFYKAENQANFSASEMNNELVPTI